jgi:DNA-binding response OmpR family regulator
VDTPKRKCILIVEDNPYLADIFGKLIEHQGIRASQAESGNDALIKMEQEPPDLVLLDLGLPDMNGLELATNVRRNEKTKSIPILVISATNEHKEDCLKKGCNDFFLKPFDFSKLFTRISDFL